MPSHHQSHHNGAKHALNAMLTKRQSEDHDPLASALMMANVGMLLEKIEALHDRRPTVVTNMFNSHEHNALAEKVEPPFMMLVWSPPEDPSSVITEVSANQCVDSKRGGLSSSRPHLPFSDSSSRIGSSPLCTVDEENPLDGSSCSGSTLSTTRLSTITEEELPMKPPTPHCTNVGQENNNGVACDSRGRCIYHPHVRLRKRKKLTLGRRGGKENKWKTLMKACPDCCMEEMLKFSRHCLEEECCR